MAERFCFVSVALFLSGLKAGILLYFHRLQVTILLFLLRQKTRQSYDLTVSLEAEN